MKDKLHNILWSSCPSGSPHFGTENDIEAFDEQTKVFRSQEKGLKKIAMYFVSRRSVSSTGEAKIDWGLTGLAYFVLIAVTLICIFG